MTKKLYVIISILMIGISCKQPPRSQDVSVNVSVPVFNADSAFHYTATQVEFGPRVPNTLAHDSCGNYLAGELRRFGASVTEQETSLRLHDNTSIRIKNIIGVFQPENKTRVLLFAHWDSRPYADNDPNPANQSKAIDGANDGAGACAALLEIARLAGINQPNVGLDVIFFDAEDWGLSTYSPPNNRYGDWCMGSKYWAQNPHVQNYTAKYGILLDMVSAPDALFYKEYASVRNAAPVVKKIWEAARATGYDSYFVNENGGSIEDDHVQVFKYRKIPCVDIIQYDPNTTSGFGDYWHTLGDNIDSVSKKTLEAVGQTILYVLYHEKQ
jgi:hypothetical protein